MASAAAGEVITQDTELDDVKDPKKKRFFKLKNIKQLFTRKKRNKSKDDDLKTKSLANVSESLEREDTTDDDVEAGRISGSLSMSHDSVFSPEKSRDASLGELTKSMENLPGAGFKKELASKLGLHPPGGETSHGHRQRHTIAADVLLENDIRARADKSYESDQSVLSMESSENEIEEDFFRDKWASNSSLAKRTTSPDPGFESADMDLNVVSSTSGLNISAAKHKIAIKPKGKRASAHILARRHRTTSPKPPGMQTLPEESPATHSSTTKPDVLSEDEGLNSTASLESLGSSGKNSPLPAIEPTADYDEEPAPKPVVPKASPRIAKKPSIISPRPSVTKSSGQKETESKPPNSSNILVVKKDTTAKVETQHKAAKETTDNNLQKASVSSKEDISENAPEFTKVVLKKTSSSEEKLTESPEKKSVKEPEKTTTTKPSSEDYSKEAKKEKLKPGLNETNHVIIKNKSESETKSTVSQVVMRPKSTTSSVGDTSKRQTIAVLSPTEEEDKESSSLAVKRVVSKRSSWIEQTAQDKESVEDSSKDRKDQTPPQKNEFAQMFNKFQRRASQKKPDDPDKKPTTTAATTTGVKAGSPRVIDNKADAEQTGATSPQPVPSPKSGASLSPLASPSSHSVVSKSPTRSSPLVNTTTTSSAATTTVVASSSSVAPVSPGASTAVAGESKPKNSFVVSKSVSVQPAQDSKSRTVVIDKPVKSPENTAGAKLVTSPEKKTVEFFPKKTVIIEASTKPAAVVVSVADTKDSALSSESSKAKSIVINKQAPIANSTSSKTTEDKTENDENAQPKSDAKPSTPAYKRTSPMQKDRVRSQTLPDPAVLTQKVANQNTSSDLGAGSPAASPQRSKSMKPTTTTTATTTPADGKASGDGKPSWVAMAKKKTVDWNKDTKEQGQEKAETEGDQTEAPDVSTEIKSKKSIKDLMSKFQ